MAKWLTKSDYTSFLVHPALLWLRKHDKDSLPEFDEIAQARFDQGNEIEEYARKLFAGGTLVEAEIFDMADKTAELVKLGPSTGSGNNFTLFQAAVLTERKLYAAADVLVRVDPPVKPEDDKPVWDMYEVKSSNSVKAGHLDDLAFQWTAFKEGRYEINKVYVIHVNAQYVKKGEIDAKKLLKIVDVTDQVKPLLPKTAKRIDKALEVIALPAVPDMDPKHASHLKRWMEVYNHLHGPQPPDSIYNLIRLTPQQAVKFGEAGITKISQIPAGRSSFKLKPQQKTQVEVVKLGRRAIHKLKIQHELAKLKYPIYFFDYETVGPGIPLFDDTRPYQNLPFQYSLHILPAHGAELEHKEFLARGSEDPVPTLLKQMKEDIGPEGSVVVWFKDFEGGVNQAMAYRHPEYREFLLDVNERIFDIMEIFSLNLYADPGFNGSSSIKKVLPVLVPAMNYKDLGIGEGMTASLRWYKAARGQMTKAEAEQVYTDLLEYCGQDTLAMVRIYQFLLHITDS